MPVHKSKNRAGVLRWAFMFTSRDHLEKIVAAFLSLGLRRNGRPMMLRRAEE